MLPGCSCTSSASRSCTPLRSPTSARSPSRSSRPSTRGRRTEPEGRGRAVSLFRQYLAQRLLASVVTLLGVSVIVFLMVRLLPGDPAQVLAGLLATEEDVARLRVDLGLNQPLYVQYGVFVDRLLHGNLGRSART